MNYIDQRYNSTEYPIIVTENGISSKGNGTDEDPELNDPWRRDFYHGYIGQLERAVNEDKVICRNNLWFIWTHFIRLELNLKYKTFYEPQKQDIFTNQ